MAYEDIKDKGFDSRTTEEQQEIATKGGIASGEARRKKKDLKEALNLLLEKSVGTDKNGEKISGAQAIALKQFEKALKGDTKAFEVVRDTAGQKPVERVEVGAIDQSLIDEVEKMVMEDDTQESD